MSRLRPEGRQLTLTRLVTGVLLSTLALPLAALTTDREQPIRITADQAIRDEKQGFTLYRGSVEMEQGSLRINAGKLTVFHEGDGAERILAEGSPAHMQQRPEPTEPLMHARAQRIEYFKNEERILLQEEASIEQDGSTVTGDSIEYLIDEQLVRAESSNTAGSEGRVEVVIPANKLEEDGEPGSVSPDSAPQDPPGDRNSEAERGETDSQ